MIKKEEGPAGTFAALMEEVDRRQGSRGAGEQGSKASPSPSLWEGDKIEIEATYQAALKLVARIDEELTRGVTHYRNKAGVLLTHLDEVVRAILSDDLQLCGEPVSLWGRDGQ